MKFKLLVFLILILAFFLRFWQLGENPASLDWDEASLGYNAYSILKTSKDEYGNKLPLSIRSFNDYKPPLYTYLTVPSVAVLGLNELATRLPSAIFGFLAVVISLYLVKELFPSVNKKIHLFFLLFFAISPWHLQFSRIAFEANVALFFFLTGLLFLIKSIKNGYFFIWSTLSFGLSLYAYHSPRLVVPLLLFFFILLYLRKFWGIKRWVLAGFIILFIIVLPLVKEIRSSTGARFSSVSVINPDEKLGQSIKLMQDDIKKGDIPGTLMHNRRIVFAREILGGYLDHFNFDFLFIAGDPPGRHHAAGMGMLYYFDLLFVPVGIFYLLGEKDLVNRKMLFLWFILAPVASALTSGTPHAVRSLLYLPVYQIFSAFGLWIFLRKINSILAVLFPYSMIILISFNFFYYLHMYYIHTPVEYAQWWQWGYKQAVEEVGKYENRVGRVLFTYKYDQPYIYFLFYKKINPAWYQQNWGTGEIERARRSFGRYEFRNIEWDKDKNLSNTLLVGTRDEIPDGQSGLIKDIKFPDGSVAFRIILR